MAYLNNVEKYDKYVGSWYYVWENRDDDDYDIYYGSDSWYSVDGGSLVLKEDYVGLAVKYYLTEEKDGFLVFKRDLLSDLHIEENCKIVKMIDETTIGSCNCKYDEADSVIAELKAGDGTFTERTKREE